MRTWIVVIFLSIIAAGGLALQKGWLPGGGNRAAGLADRVSADTAFYMGGRLPREQVEAFREMPLAALSPYQLQQALTALQANGTADSPGARFVRALLGDLLSHAATYGELYDYLGVDLGGAHAVYLDDLYPVMRLALDDPEAFRAVLERASQRSGLEPRRETIADQKVSLWSLTAGGSAPSLSLAVRLADGTATLTLLRENEAPAARRQRLALSRPENPLSRSGELEALRDEYDFSDNWLGFLHLERLTRRLLEPGNGADRPAPLSRLPDTCRDDAMALASGAPRWVLGSTETPKAAPGTSTARAVLEIRQARVRSSLETLRGHIPGHALGTDDPVMALGLGLDINSLVPAATELWSLFVEADFQCPTLVKAQQRLANTPPAMLGAMTGMLQGVRGLGLSLYDTASSEQSPAPDALLSIAATSPQTLVSLLNNNPLGFRAGIPTDGSLKQVDLSALAPGLQVTVGIQGKHLVIFSGEQGAAAARDLASESVDDNGLGSLAVDYARLADLLESMPSAPVARVEDLPEQTSPCLEKARVVWTLRAQPLDFRYRTDILPGGLATDMAVTMVPDKAPVPDPVGEFSVLDRTDACRTGQPAGRLVLRDDGTGRYERGNDRCTLEERLYDWRRDGSRLAMAIRETRSRPNCGAQWRDGKARQAECLLNRTDAGLQCLYREGGRERLWQLQRR